MARTKATEEKAVVAEEAIAPTKTPVTTQELNTAEQIAGGRRTTEFIVLVDNYRRTWSEGRLEALAAAYGVTKDDSQTWKDRAEVIAEEQIASQGRSSYEDVVDNIYGSQAIALSTTPVPQPFPIGIRIAPNGDKVRTKLYGVGLAN